MTSFLDFNTSLYFLLGIALAIVLIMFVIKMISSRLTTQKRTSNNELSQVTTIIGEYENDLMPLMNDFNVYCKDNNIPAYKGKIANFSFSDIKKQNRSWTSAWLTSINSPLIEKNNKILNSLESFTNTHKKELLTNNTVFNLIGLSYCNNVRILYPYISALRTEDENYCSSIVNLYNLWSVRIREIYHAYIEPTRESYINDVDWQKNLVPFSTFLNKELSLLQESFNLTWRNEEDNRVITLASLFDSTINSGRSIINLGNDGFVREAFMLSRSLLENIINLSYLLICDESDFNNHIEYTNQKSYRAIEAFQRALKSLNKEVIIPPPIPPLAEALEKFTSKRGKEITRWTSLSLEDRISEVEKAVPKFSKEICLSTMHFIYPNASEALHGTIYGNLFISGYGYSGPKFDVDKIKLNMGHNIKLVQLLCALTIGESFHVINVKGNIEDVLIKSSRNRKKYIDLMSSAF